MGYPNLNVPPQIHVSQIKSPHLHNIDSVPLNLQKPIAPQPLQTVPADMTTASTSLSSSSPSSAAVAVVSSETTAQPTIEHGEMDEASSLGTSVTGWRDPAPYRCGHCHQVSNWKHVIQVFLTNQTIFIHVSLGFAVQLINPNCFFFISRSETKSKFLYK